MPRRFLFFSSLCLLTGLLFVVGCSDDSAPRSSVNIESINGNEVLDSDVYNNGDDGEPGTDDDFIVEDQVPIVLRNRPHDAGLSMRANGPFGAVVLNRYSVRLPSELELPNISGGLYLRIPSGSTAIGEVTVIPAEYKQAPPLDQLAYLGGEIRFTAEITLYGVEEDSREEVVVKGSLPVHCANWGDE
ncbi:MAG: hypothetical protein FJY88_01965 [Candidatus Eisenbacteria bacterium]|nr:hypothetical protein [Candidatus Eisenbacteria bacterium]